MLTGKKEEHDQASAKLQTHIDKLKLLAEGDEELGELILNAIQPPSTQPDPAHPSPAPPKSNLRRVNLTADGLSAIIQTFDGPITLSAVTDILAEREQITDADEKKRLRMAVQTMMRKLIETGRLIQVEKGLGKKQGVFKKVAATESTEHTESVQRTNGAERAKSDVAGAV